IRFSKDEDGEKEDWDMELLEADLLIIVDLGTEFATLFTASELFRLINDRKLKNKSVIISTNLNPEDITNQYSDRITSRLREYKVLKFFGDDIRVVKKFRK
ncbi:MAG: DNA replication protein DnaC, partial [Anaerotignum sp.]